MPALSEYRTSTRERSIDQELGSSLLFYYDGDMLDGGGGGGMGLSPRSQLGRLTGVAGDGYSKSFYYRPDGSIEERSID